MASFQVQKVFFFFFKETGESSFFGVWKANGTKMLCFGVERSKSQKIRGLTLLEIVKAGDTLSPKRLH